MKNQKKFSTNCMPVSTKKSGIWSSCVSLVCVIFIIWLLPVAFKQNVRKSFERLQIPVNLAVDKVDEFTRQLELGVISKNNLKKFCEELIGENILLRSKVGACELDAPKVIGKFKVLPSKVLRRDMVTWADEILIDVGKESGVEVNMGVICKNYAIGRIKSVSEKTSTVQLITSPQFRMVVHILDDNTVTPIIFSGCEQHDFRRFYGHASGIPQNFLDDGKNLKLVTSHLNGFFPENLMVGEIHCEDFEEGSFQFVRLNADLLTKLYEVGVLLEQQW